MIKTKSSDNRATPEWIMDLFKDYFDPCPLNPNPTTLFIKFLFHSSEIANKGFGFLIKHSRLNQVTPKRLDDLKAKGFHLSRIQIFGWKDSISQKSTCSNKN